MIRTPVLHQTHLFSQPETSTLHSSELSSRLKEQECISLIRRCNNIEQFKQAHAQAIKYGFFWNSARTSSLVAACALSGWESMEYVCSIFQQMDEPGTFEFNTMIRGYVNEMSFEEALLIYYEMLEMGAEPDRFTYPPLLKACAWLQGLEEGQQIHGHVLKLGLEQDMFVQNSLINLYGKCGETQLSCAVFEQMDAKSVASWSAVIAALARLGMWRQCLVFFGDMIREGCWKPEESTLVSVLSACAHFGDLDLGRSIHGYLLRNISDLNVIVQTSLLDMYLKGGHLQKGLHTFKKMVKKNRLSYSVMISGLAMHGLGEKALMIFSEMLEEGLTPDAVVYVSVLTACSHAGLINEALQCFDRMKYEHGIEPTVQHYGCLVDLLGRTGRLQEAFELISSMPMKPNDVVWRSFLNACKIHDNAKLGKIAAKKLLQLNSKNPGDYLLLSNVYAQAQRWRDVSLIRTELICSGLKQTPGFSLVKVQRKVYKFVSQDKSHPQCKGVYEMIHQMEWQLRFEGYLPETSQVLLDVDEEEKKQRLRGHSQKLAIAFALIHTSQGSPIRIARNVRMCSDCHTYGKLISMIYGRQIIVRDRNRFHHFTDGTCSCRDYW